MNIPALSFEEWAQELKPYQKNGISQLLKSFSEEEAIERWLSANGPIVNKPFGGFVGHDTKPFFDKFKLEFKKFICGHPDYQAYREQLQKHRHITNAIYISTIAEGLGRVLGFIPAALLAPCVAVLLGAVGKMTLNVYCQNFLCDQK